MRRHLSLLLGLALAINHVTGATAKAAQPGEPIAESIGLSKEIGSAPLWTKTSDEARRLLGDSARRGQKAVLLVGHPKHGRGTAWVISKKHRLLATNAHVADILHEANGNMLALVNGTSELHKVERVWYHPGVRRRVGGGVVIKSANPGEGPVDPHCPDVAVLQLAPGAELIDELRMVGPGVFSQLWAQPAAIMDYPGHDTQSWPQIGETAEASYHEGTIQRITDFRNNVNAPSGEKQFLQYSMSTWGGYSGSPVFLPTGEVVALHNSARYERGGGGDVKAIAHGIRVDCLWELIAHHKLEDKVPLPVAPSALNVARWLQDDPADLEIRRAIALVGEASRLIYGQQKFAEGVAKCNEAAKIAPGYAEIYNVRCDGYVNYWFHHRRQIDSDVALQQLVRAEADAKKFIGLEPSNPWGVINIVLVYNNAGQFLDNDDLNRKAYQIVSKLLQSENLPPNVRAAAYSNRAIALDNLDEDDAALRDHNEAIRLDPKNPTWLENRADFWHYQGRSDLEEQDYAAARRLRGK